MHTGEPALIDFIRDRIDRCGPVSFAWFMEQALYHPQHGYYSSGRCAIGRNGDYFTSVSVGPLFGRLLAAQFAEMWESLGRPADFTTVEQGAHHGEFAGDVLEAARQHSKDFFATLRYRIVEPFRVLRERQRQTLSAFRSKVEWRNSLGDLEAFTGVHFSNELLDAMPVHLICSRGSASSFGGQCSVIAGIVAETQWQERLVDWQNDQFVFVQQPISDPGVLAQAQRLPSRPAGYETELNLAALDWIEELARKLIRGYVLAVDYGFAREELFAPQRATGTLQCRAQHRRLASPFEEIGRADISAHIDWTTMAEHAEECGFALHGFTDQHHFIIGVISRLLQTKFSGESEPRTRRALQTLLHPEFLGTAFQLLVLAKNGGDEQLSGFKFAREPRVTLGLCPHRDGTE